MINNIKAKYQKEEQILFYNIQTQSNELLSYLLFEYSKNKEDILKTHKFVQKYIEKNGFDISLEDIYTTINKNQKNKPYNIYITDENLKIVNTTFKPDIGFDLNFAKKEFDKHKEDKIIGISAPVFETYSKDFFSFTDSYLKNTNRIMQISYRYDNTNKLQTAIENITNKNPMIADSNAYIVFNDGYVSAFMFKEFEAKKITTNAIKEIINTAKELSIKLDNLDLFIEDIFINNTSYKNFYFKHENPIFKDAKIIYSVKFDQSFLLNEIRIINIFTVCLVTIFMLSIYFLLKIRDKEISLEQKDTFIKYSVHEIKTPLSIISLNNELRSNRLGEDNYTSKIQSAIKTLENSYEDMSFFISKEHQNNHIKLINITEFTKKRIEYFSSIAKHQGRDIEFKSNSNCEVHISEIELTRLIDNNLSNAIKYSKIKTLISVTLDKDTLYFSNIGKEIEDTKVIFDKYKRDNNVTGGHGLGLSIVRDIAKKYDIKINVTSKNNINSFSYKFKCHKADT